MMRKGLFILLILCAVACSPHTLFKDGTSDYTIVLAPDASPVERYAARELQTWVREVSGAELPVSTGDAAGKRLLIGSESPVGNDDAFVYYSDGEDIVFRGKTPRATLYAVYAFLENELDCRWYSSTVSVAPKRDRWSFRTLSCEEAPGIRIRDNCVLDVRVNPVFSARMRNNFVRIPSPDGEGTVPGSAEGYWGVHALGTHVPVEKYYREHPEYFCLRDGKRFGGYGQPCLSNPEVLQITVESVRRIMREQPDFLIYSVEQNDNQLFCQCDACTALAEQYGGQSGVMVWFVNQVADAVKDEFPDKFIGTFAYQYTRHAPKDIVPRDNVVIRLCSIECCMWHAYDECEQNVAFLKDLEDWGTIAPHLYIWDYVTDFAQYCLPVANWKTLQPHIRDFRDNHAIGILEEGDYQTVTCELREMRSWILSKLMWNPDADVEALIRDFTDGFYGAGGKFVRDYLDLEERILRRDGVHGNCYVSPSDSMFTDEFIREGRKLFAEARKAVGADSVLAHRLETAEFPLCFLQMEKNPLLGMQSDALSLARRVIRRDGFNRMSEWEWPGSRTGAQALLERYDQIEKNLREAPLMPAADVKPQRNGVAFTRYEGGFMTTGEMLERGKVTGRGTQSDIRVEEPDSLDHFGYVFDTWLNAPEEGVYQFNVISDDGAVLLVDGRPVIDIDGSHSVEGEWAFVNLAKGFHRLELRYFEDCEGQRLDLRLRTPGGYDGPLPNTWIYLP